MEIKLEMTLYHLGLVMITSTEQMENFSVLINSTIQIYQFMFLMSNDMVVEIAENHTIILDLDLT